MSYKEGADAPALASPGTVKRERMQAAERGQALVGSSNVISHLAVSGRKPVRVFQADWTPQGRNTLEVIHHTPEICWVEAGAQVVDCGLPLAVDLVINGAELTWECRTLRFPGRLELEVVLWCTMVAGENLESAYRFRPSVASSTGHGELESSRRSRFLALSQVSRALERRISRRGAKQFVRVSISSMSPSPADIDYLAKFLSMWIQVHGYAPATRLSLGNRSPVVQGGAKPTR